MDSLPFIRVTCAIIRRDGLILTARRGPAMNMAGKWEFPGGKVEAGESEEETIRREILEELGLAIRVTGRLTPVLHNYGSFQIELIPFIAEVTGGEPVPHEHDEVRWLQPEALTALDWAEADVPIVRQLLP